MKCPVCAKELKTVSAGSVEVDYCSSGCHGVWLDSKEIDQLDEASEFIPDEVLADSKPLVRGIPRVINCPRCTGEVLVRQTFDVKDKVEINQCWNSGGIWLDAGELKTIRNQYATFADRKADVNKKVDAFLAARVKDMKNEAKQRERMEERQSLLFRSIKPRV